MKIARTWHNNTPEAHKARFTNALTKSDTAEVRLLAEEQGIDPNQIIDLPDDKVSVAPLVIAILQIDPAMVKTLIDCGANPKNKQGLLSLHKDGSSTRTISVLDFLTHASKHERINADGTTKDYSEVQKLLNPYYDTLWNKLADTDDVWGAIKTLWNWGWGTTPKEESTDTQQQSLDDIVLPSQQEELVPVTGDTDSCDELD